MARFFHSPPQKGALKCHGKYCGQKCRGDRCALFCGKNLLMNSDHCGQFCTGEDCARLCDGKHCGENCTGVGCAVNCNGDYCGQYCLGDNCADGCTGTDCGLGNKSSNLPCDQYELDWHCSSSYLTSTCVWNGTSCVTCNPVMDNTNIKDAIDLYNTDPVSAKISYCDISTWDTSSVTSMAYLFYRSNTNSDYQTVSTADHDISSWDVS